MLPNLGSNFCIFLLRTSCDRVEPSNNFWWQRHTLFCGLTGANPGQDGFCLEFILVGIVVKINADRIVAKQQLRNIINNSRYSALRDGGGFPKSDPVFWPYSLTCAQILAGIAAVALCGDRVAVGIRVNGDSAVTALGEFAGGGEETYNLSV